MFYQSLGILILLISHLLFCVMRMNKLLLTHQPREEGKAARVNNISLLQICQERLRSTGQLHSLKLLQGLYKHRNSMRCSTIKLIISYASCGPCHLSCGISKSLKGISPKNIDINLSDWTFQLQTCHIYPYLQAINWVSFGPVLWMDPIEGLPGALAGAA